MTLSLFKKGVVCSCGGFKSCPKADTCLKCYRDRVKTDLPTKREEEAAKLFCSGLPMSKVASRLGVNHKTAHSHVYEYQFKLGLKTRVHLVHHALKTGLVQYCV